MASSYSALKIELMATGEDDQIWGDKTNQNWLAMQQAVSQSGVVPFASADQVLTLVDSSALQPARAARLVANGTSGGARNLTLPAIDKLTVFENQLADPVTVKVAGGGAGQVVPAGRSVPLLTFATDVHAQFDYLPALTLGGNLTVNGAGSFSGPLNGQPITVGPLPVNYNGMRMDSDGASYSRYYFNYGQNTVFNYNWSTQALTYIVNGALALTITLDRSATFVGNIGVNGLYINGNLNGVTGAVAAFTMDATYTNLLFNTADTSMFQYNRNTGDNYYYSKGVWTATLYNTGDFGIARNFTALIGTFSNYVRAPIVYVGDNSMYLQTDTSASYIVLNGWSCRLTYGKPTGLLQYVVNDASVFTVDYGGRITCHGVDAQGGVIYCGPLRPTDINTASGITCGPLNCGAISSTQVGCSGQGFFSGNLNAATNNGVGANCVMVGYFVSGSYYNPNQAGVAVGGTQAFFAYAGSGSNAFWSTVASDRHLKDNIKRPSRDALDVVRKLPIWSCDYIAPKADPELLDDPEAWPEFREHWPFAFMADEVEAALPNATIKHEGRSVALHPQHLIATLWAAVQQLTERLESAEAKLAAS